MRAYLAKFTPEKRSSSGKSYVVSFPGLPFGVTQGDTEEDALDMAHDAVLTVLDALMRERKPLPTGISSRKKPRRNHKFVVLSAVETAKAELYESLRRRGWRKDDHARRLKLNQVQIDRTLDLFHATRMDQLEAAFAALGQRLTVRVEKRAA